MHIAGGTKQLQVQFDPSPPKKKKKKNSTDKVILKGKGAGL